MANCLSTMRETRVRSLGGEDLLEKEMATHSSILAWKIPWMEEPDRLRSMGSQRVGHNRATSLHLMMEKELLCQKVALLTVMFLTKLMYYFLSVMLFIHVKIKLLHFLSLSKSFHFIKETLFN